MTLTPLPGERARRQRHIFSGHSFRDNGRPVYPPPAGEVPVPCGGPGPSGGQRLEVSGSHQGGTGEQVTRDRTATGNPRPYVVSYLTLP